jgi:hypothetical protein
MKAMMLKMSVMALAVMTMVGCASNSENAGPSDEDQVMAVAQAVSDALKAADVDAMVSHFSDDFSNDEGASKDATTTALKGYAAGGFLDDLDVDLSSMKVKVEGDKATAAPIDLEAGFGAISLDLDLEKRDGKWLVVYMSQY